MMIPVILAAASLGVSVQPQPKEKLPQESRFMKYERPQKWELESYSLLLAGESISDIAYQTSRGAPSRNYDLDEWQFDELVVITPVVLRTASSFANTQKPTGGLWIGDGDPVDDEPTLIGPYQSQAVYARWETDQPASSKKVMVRQTMSYTSFETVFDEDAAMAVGWPSQWPAEAQSTFLPQQYISLDENGNAFDAADTTIADLVASWTDGSDPKSIPPVQLAKWLAGKVQEHVSVIKPGMTTRRDMDLELGVAAGAKSGLEVKSAPETARSGKGSKHDATALLAAVYREAGLPCRIIIGYQEKEKDGRRRLNNNDKIRSWVEFAIYDEQLDELTWVPVDVARLRERSSRMYPLTQKWKYFGTHDELDDVVPYAFHFHPPTDVRSYGAPAMFGLTMVPAPPDRATQYISLNQSRAAVKPKEDP